MKKSNKDQEPPNKAFERLKQFLDERRPVNGDEPDTEKESDQVKQKITKPKRKKKKPD